MCVTEKEVVDYDRVCSSEDSDFHAFDEATQDESLSPNVKDTNKKKEKVNQIQQSWMTLKQGNYKLDLVSKRQFTLRKAQIGLKDGVNPLRHSVSPWNRMCESLWVLGEKKGWKFEKDDFNHNWSTPTVPTLTFLLLLKELDYCGPIKN